MRYTIFLLLFLINYTNLTAQTDSIELNYFLQIHDFSIKNNSYKFTQPLTNSLIESDSIIFNVEQYFNNMKLSKKQIYYEDSLELIIASRTLKSYNESYIYDKNESYFRFIWFKEGIQKIVGINLNPINGGDYFFILKKGDGELSRKGNLIINKKIEIPKRKHIKLIKFLKKYKFNITDMFCGKNNMLEFTVPDLIVERVEENNNYLLVLNECKLLRKRKYRWLLKFHKKIKRLAKKFG